MLLYNALHYYWHPLVKMSKLGIWWISLISHWKNRNIQPLIKNIYSEKKKIPHQAIIIFSKTMCATIIGTHINDYEQKVTEAFFPFILYFLKLISV